MEHLSGYRGWNALFGDRRPRGALVVSIVGLLGFASVAFLLGIGVRFYEFWGWLVIVPVIAVLAGVFGAGLLPTVGSLWLINLWGYAFPPLVGYLSGQWTGTGRYTTPRMAGFAYGSARAELLGGLENGVELGLVFALIVGTIAYFFGHVLSTLPSMDR